MSCPEGLIASLGALEHTRKDPTRTMATVEAAEW